MKIGNVNIKNNIFLAPMAGYTNVAFRLLCSELGWGMTFTEFIKNDFRYNERSFISENELNVAVQIMGAEPDEVLKVAQELLRKYQNISFININMGCPFINNIGVNEGCALMKNPDLVAKIIYNLCSHVNIPITIKIRKGYDSSNVNYMEIAKIAEKNGAKAIIIHARTLEQIYDGEVDLECIKLLKETINIPVIGNGGIENTEDAFNMLTYTKCDAVMVGRAALNNPAIISNIITNNLMQYKNMYELAFRYISLAMEYQEFINFTLFKKSLITLLHEKNNKDIRLMMNINRAKDYYELLNLLQVYEK